ncbi:MAG: hypothetical protein HOV79_04520, partial [Hamadaea sp.]|nr:hypothetical protein [Hamadaea sp.]
PLATGLAVAARAHETAHPALWALAAATLLAGVQALCLILAAHRRPALAAATAWCLASLVVAAAFLADGLLPGLPAAAAGTAVLLFGYPFAFVPAVSAMIDPWSHR